VTSRARPSGRRPGDSGTRDAILAVARRQFAEQGYDRTSLRGIALEAGVDPSLVGHFYGTKQELFVTVVELPFDPSDVLPRLLAGDPEDVGARLAGFVVGMLEMPEARRRVTGLVRAAASEPEAARIVRELVTREMFVPMAEHLGTGNARLRASFVGSQVVGLVMARYVVAVEPLASAAPDVVVATLGPIFQRLLTGPMPDA
jgi:AcrR family transcriptional regulator